MIRTTAYPRSIASQTWLLGTKAHSSDRWCWILDELLVNYLVQWCQAYSNLPPQTSAEAGPSSRRLHNRDVASVVHLGPESQNMSSQVPHPQHLLPTARLASSLEATEEWRRSEEGKRKTETGGRASAKGGSGGVLERGTDAGYPSATQRHKSSFSHRPSLREGPQNPRPSGDSMTAGWRTPRRAPKRTIKFEWDFKSRSPVVEFRMKTTSETPPGGRGDHPDLRRRCCYQLILPVDQTVDASHQAFGQPFAG